MDAVGDREPEILVSIDDDVPEQLVETIRASVVTMARRGSATTLETVDRNRELHVLAQRMEKPLKEMVLADDDAAAAFEALSDTAFDDAGSIAAPPPPEWPLVEVTGAEPETDAPPQVFVAPWHFQWQWHKGQPPTSSVQDRPNGRIEVSTHADQNANWSDCRGGFGVALTTNRVVAATGRSLRRTNHFFLATGGSFGGNATVEGGCEMTALEGGTNLLSQARDRRFRRRVGAGEEAMWNEPGFETGDNIQVDWIMVPGRTYTFCVAGWVFGEAHGGLGTASIGSVRLSAQIISMNLFLTD